MVSRDVLLAKTNDEAKRWLTQLVWVGQKPLICPGQLGTMGSWLIGSQGPKSLVGTFTNFGESQRTRLCSLVLRDEVHGYCYLSRTRIKFKEGGTRL